MRNSAYIALSTMMFLLVGCASEKPEIPPQATSGLMDIRGQLMSLKSQIQNTTVSAKDLMTQRVDVTPQVKRFEDEVAKLQAQVGDTRAQMKEATNNADAYFARWDSQLQTMSGSLQESGEKRRKESMHAFDKLRQIGTDTRASYGPYILNMSDAAKYLNADPTSAGVKGAIPTIKKGMDAEPDLLRNIDRMIEQIDSIRAGK